MIRQYQSCWHSERDNAVCRAKTIYFFVFPRAYLYSTAYSIVTGHINPCLLEVFYYFYIVNKPQTIQLHGQKQTILTFIMLHFIWRYLMNPQWDLVFVGILSTENIYEGLLQLSLKKFSVTLKIKSNKGSKHRKILIN